MRHVIFRTDPYWADLNDVMHSFVRVIYGDSIKITPQRGTKTKNGLRMIIRGMPGISNI